MITVIIIIRNLYSAVMTLGGYRGAGRGLAGVCLVYEASRERLVESRTAFELSFLSFFVRIPFIYNHVSLLYGLDVVLI